MISYQPWRTVSLLDLLAKEAFKQEDAPLPDYAVAIAAGTATYEDQIRALWEEFKKDPTKANAQLFAEELKLASNDTWPSVFAASLGIELDELTEAQLKVLDDELEKHHKYIDKSLVPDVIRGIEDGITDFSSMDYRTIFMYAGALWSLGFLGTVIFDGLSIRDLADVFMFVGPNDEDTCTGERGCAQFANKFFTVAEILARDIIPGHLRCLTNCRHMLLPIVSPLTEVEKELARKGGPGSGNWGHAGRPGRVGGSAPTSGMGAAMSIRSGPSAKARQEAARHPVDPVEEKRKRVRNWLTRPKWEGGPPVLQEAWEEELDEPRIQVIDRMTDWMMRHDERVMNHIESIVVARTDGSFVMEWTRGGGSAAEGRDTAGFWNPAYKAITIRPSRSKAAQEVFDHEVGHAVLKGSHNRGLWYGNYRNDKFFDRFTKYAETNASEGFSETYMAYIARGGRNRNKSSRIESEFHAIDEVLDGLPG